MATVRLSPRAHGQQAAAAGVPEDDVDLEYPIHRGAGYYELSDGTKVRGKGEAQARQDALDELG